MKVDCLFTSSFKDYQNRLDPCRIVILNSLFTMSHTWINVEGGSNLCLSTAEAYLGRIIFEGNVHYLFYKTRII